MRRSSGDGALTRKLVARTVIVKGLEKIAGAMNATLRRT
jgi:hypothetical protein